MQQNTLKQKLIKNLSTIMPANEAESEINFVLKEHFGLTSKDLLLYPEKITKYEKELEQIVNTRISTRTPLQYILNKAVFLDEIFYVDENTLIPRPETEILVTEVIKHLKKSSNILEIGTGSGCIAIMISKSLENDNVVSCDICENALNVARKNANTICKERTISFVSSNIYENISGKFDAIISNPPYIPFTEKPGMAPEVIDHEPSKALFAANNGMFFYEKIIEGAKNYLNKTGFLAFEIGINQSEKIKEILYSQGFKKVITIPDLSSIDRVVLAWYN